MNINDQKQVIIFDVDGTLINTLPQLVDAANDLLCQQKLQAVSINAMRPALNIGLNAMVEAALNAQPIKTSKQTQWVLSEFMPHYEGNYLAQSLIYPNVKDVLPLLSSHFQLAICTNRDKKSTKTLLQSNEINHYFDCVITLNDVQERKPNPEGLLKILTHYGISPEHAVFIGDSELDCMAAEKAHIPFIVHTNGYANKAEDMMPHIFSFQHYQQLAEYLKLNLLKG